MLRNITHFLYLTVYKMSLIKEINALCEQTAKALCTVNIIYCADVSNVIYTFDFPYTRIYI